MYRSPIRVVLQWEPLKVRGVEQKCGARMQGSVSLKLLTCNFYFSSYPTLHATRTQYTLYVSVARESSTHLS